MEVIINGRPKELAGTVSLVQLLAELGLPVQAVAVQHNGVVVRREEFAARTVRDGDRLEIVRPIGGGSPAQGRTGEDGRRPV